MLLLKESLYYTRPVKHTPQFFFLEKKLNQKLFKSILTLSNDCKDMRAKEIGDCKFAEIK